MLTDDEVAVLLNRSLTAAETDNFDLYLNIATKRFEDLLCMDTSSEEENRTFQSRIGYRTVYVDPFTTITSVTVDGNVIDEDRYTIKQNDKFNGTWYNVIEFDAKCTGKNVVVNAEWGFGETLPVDLQLLLAKLFAQGSTEQTSDSLVKSKKIEDFTVTFKDSATYDEFILTNSSVIDKYSQCDSGYIRHGNVYRGYDDLRPVYN